MMVKFNPIVFLLSLINNLDIPDDQIVSSYICKVTDESERLYQELSTVWNKPRQKLTNEFNPRSNFCVTWTNSNSTYIRDWAKDIIESQQVQKYSTHDI